MEDVGNVIWIARWSPPPRCPGSSFGRETSTSHQHRRSASICTRRVLIEKRSGTKRLPRRESRRNNRRYSEFYVIAASLGCQQLAATLSENEIAECQGLG